VKISDCITQLQGLLKKHGDIQCESDCPYCTRSFRVNYVAIAPETVRLNHASVDGPVGTRGAASPPK
jgi:hypothetical protein